MIHSSLFFIYLIENLSLNNSENDIHFCKKRDDITDNIRKLTPLNDKFTNKFESSKDKSWNIYLGTQLTFITNITNRTNRTHIQINDNISMEIQNLYYDYENKFLFEYNNKNNTEICQNLTDFIDTGEIKIIDSKSEFIFVDYSFLPNIILFFGIFIVIFGAYYNIFFLWTHLAILVYYIIRDINELDDGYDYISYPLFVLLVAAIIGVGITILFKFKEKNRIILKIKCILYVIILGYFFFKSLFYFVLIFVNISPEIYLILMFIFSFICAPLEIFNILTKFQKILYIISTAISGSFYIIKSIGYILGGYYSDTLKIKAASIINEDINFSGDCKGIIGTYSGIQVLIIILSIICQYIHYKYKEIEIFGFSNLLDGIGEETKVLLKDFHSEEKNKEENANITQGNNTGNSRNDSSNKDPTNNDDNDINDQED